MAGNYPDVPSWRMALDRDGTIICHNRAGVITQYSGAQVQALNDESSGGPAGTGFDYSTDWLTVVFPEKRDLDAYFIANVFFSSGSVTNLQVSTNTTNGVDGTWTSYSANRPSTPWDGVNYRTGIVSATALAIKGFRCTFSAGGNFGLQALHLYGEIAPTENIDRLELWHPTLAQRLAPAYLDWGDTPRSSSADKTFRVKNLSPTLTANSVRVAMEILTDGSPSVVAQHTLSFAGGSFVAQVNVGNLAPGALSGVVTMRRVTPANAQLGLFAFRTFAEANSWS